MDNHIHQNKSQELENTNSNDHTSEASSTQQAIPVDMIRRMMAGQPPNLTPQKISWLQRTVGNRTVQRILSQQANVIQRTDDIHTVEDDATIDIPENVTEEQLRQIIHDHPVIGRRLIYRSDEGEHAGDMLQEHSNLSEVFSQISDHHGPVRMRFRFIYVPIRGADGWRVRDIEIEVRDDVSFDEGDTVAPDPPPDLQERITREAPDSPHVDLPPDTPEDVWREIGRIFWDPEGATPTDPDGLLPSMPGMDSGLQSVIDYNMRNLRNADAIQRGGADYLGYADALARWATGTDPAQLTTIPADMRERVMGRSLSLAGYRTGAGRAVQLINDIENESQRQGARHAIRERYGHTRSRIREALLQQTTSDMSDQLRALMPVR